MKDPVWLIDVDGVLANFLNPTLNIVSKLGLGEYTPEHFQTWDVFDTIPKEHEPAIESHWHEPGWCASLPPYERATETIQQLREIGQVVFVTTAMHKAPHWMWERYNWLQNHMGSNGRDVIFASSKQHIKGHLLVDDKPSNVLNWSAAHPGSVAVLWEHPYNRKETLPGHILRTDSWEEVLRVARNISNENRDSSGEYPT